jgi:hypothetical protein
MTNLQLHKILCQEFSHPFVDDGLVKSSYDKKTGMLSIRIDRRDVEINRRGTVIGAGTCMCMPATSNVNDRGVDAFPHPPRHRGKNV